MKTTLITLAFGALAVLTIAATAAPPSQYLGTRGDVRVLCQNEGTFLLEGGNRRHDLAGCARVGPNGHTRHGHRTRRVRNADDGKHE